MVAADERRHPDPLGAFAAHTPESDDVAYPFGLHHRHHRVATDATADERARLGAGAAIVRAARTVERGPMHRERDRRARWADHLVERAQPTGESSRQSGVQRGEQRVDVERPVAGDEQITPLVASADDPRVMGAVVERTLQEPFERVVLLLDDHHLVEALGELAGLGRVERYGHQQLEQTDACGT